jgi:hypothetical protein
MSSRLTCKARLARGKARLASAAAGRSNKAATPRRERVGSLAGQPHSQHDPVGNTDDVQFRYFGRSSDDSFGETKAARKILEIVWGRHQHCMRCAVVAERDWGLLGQGAFPHQRRPIAPRLP